MAVETSFRWANTTVGRSLFFRVKNDDTYRYWMLVLKDGKPMLGEIEAEKAISGPWVRFPHQPPTMEDAIKAMDLVANMVGTFGG